MYGEAFESARREMRRIAVLAGVGVTFLVSAIPAQAAAPSHAGAHGPVVPPQAALKSHGGGDRGHKVA